MMFGTRRPCAAAALLLVAAIPASAYAQSDAEIALNKARQAFGAAHFEQARDLLVTAAQTDAKNPDIHLLLGKSYYQLGDVEQAVKAWRTTIRLAPEQAYAKLMLAKLRGADVDVKTRLAIAAALLRDRLYQQAAGELALVRTDAKLADEHRQRLLLLEAELALGEVKPATALHRIEELTIRFPDQKDVPATQLLTARAQVAAGGDSLADGLTKLEDLAREHAETQLGATAELEITAFRFHQGAVDVDSVLTWIDAHADHPAKPRAHEVLTAAVNRQLAVASQGPAAKADAALTASEAKAMSIAAKLYPTLLTASQADALTSTLVKHFQTRYHTAETLGTASDAMVALTKLKLPPSSQRLVASAQRALAAQIATAQYDRIAGRLLQGLDESTAMAEWIKAHPEHEKAAVAREALLEFYLASTLRQKPISPDSPLAAADAKAFAVAAEIYEESEQVSDAARLTTRLDKHLKSRYAAGDALGAAEAGYEALLELKPPTASQAILLHGLAAVQTRIAIDQLTADAEHQRLEAGPLPPSLKAVLATLEKINQLTPATPSFAQQAALGRQVAALSSHLAWPPQAAAVKPTQEWAVQIMLPVVADGSQPEAVKVADATIAAIVAELTALKAPTAASLPAQVQARRLAVLHKGSDAWGLAMRRRAELLTSEANRVFQQNIDERRIDANAEVSKPQQALIDTLRELAAALPAQAPTALSQLQAAMAVPLSSQHYDLVISAYEALQPALPAAQQFDSRSAQLRLLIQQVADRDSIAMQRGLKIEPQLDPLMKKALLGAYELQRDLEEGDSRLAQARAVLTGVTAYYRELEMFDVVEEALKVRAEKAVPTADRYAQYMLAGLHFDRAKREQTQQLKDFRGRELIKFTPAFAAAEAAYQKFINDHPDDARADAAVGQLFEIARLFQQHQRDDIAAEVYARLEEFAAGQPQLNQVPVGRMTVAERAALANAIAWHQHASRDLERTLSSQAADAPPPAELSPQYLKALAAFAGAVERHPDSPLLTTAFARTLLIGTEYADHGAWDVADGVYAGILAQKLPLRHPERIEFARALCQLGKVMPAHSRAILTTFAEGNKLQIDDADRVKLAGNRPGGSIGGEQGQGEGSGQVPAKDDDPRDGVPSPATSKPTGLPALTVEQILEARQEAELLAAVQQQQGQQAAQIAQLRDAAIQFRFARLDNQSEEAPTRLVSTVISDAELDRQQKVLDKAYTMLQALRTRYPQTAVAAQSRAEILIIIGHWRKLSKWKRSADLALRYLQDNPKDADLPSIRQEVARDYLAWAAAGVDEKGSKQELLDIVNRRHAQAREELADIVKNFPDNDALRQQAQWDVANSFLTQARVIAMLSPTLARGQYVRSANELMRVARAYHDHPKIGEVPQMLWSISNELSSRKHFDEAISVWNSLANNYPLHSLGQQAALQIARTYQTQNKPLRAVEAYVELNFARGGDDTAMQDAIYQLATQLKNQKRWVEALHALETFVDSFPTHANAGQALTMIGQIHQANEVWEDAIAAYDRVIIDYPDGEWVKEARWSIAECTINLSRWRDAIDSYDKFADAYQGDDQSKQAVVRIEILKDLERYQRVVDEEGQRKSFDAQYQIGEIVRSKLANNVKAIIEFRKVATTWPESHLADDALYQVGVTYLTLGETEQARKALLAAAEKYPTSPLADDALLKIGQSYQQEAAKYALGDTGFFRGGSERHGTEPRLPSIARQPASQSWSRRRAGIEA